MNKFYISFFAIIFSLGLHAQNVTKGAIFTTGGNYNAPGNFVKLYAYDIDQLDYSVVDSVLGDFSNHVISDGHYAYMHVGRGGSHPLGGDRIFKYDLLNQTYQAIDSTEQLMGFKKFEIIGDRLLITRGYPATSEFVKVLDKNDLSTVLYSDANIEGVCDGIAVADNKAFVASTNLGDSGVVNVIDLGATISNLGAYTLDTLSSGAKDIFMENGMIYMTSLRYNLNYTVKYAGVTRLNLADSTFTTDTIGLSNAAGFDYLNGLILGDFGNPLETYNTLTGNRNLVFNAYPTAAKFDPNSGSLLVQTTDYFSFGEVIYYDNTGNPIDTIETDVAGSAMSVVTNYIPTAVNDTVNGGALQPSDISYFDVVANDFDMDEDIITLDTLLNQPIGGAVVEIVGDSIKLTNASQLIDKVYYVISDPWGDSDTAFISFVLIGSVKNIEKSLASVYPNPAHRNLNISTPFGVINSVRVADLSGKNILLDESNDSTVSVDLSTFSTGIYFVKVEVNGVFEMHRVVVY